jgi:hypothetical protein
MNPKKVLILGCPRSGTSLLTGMVGAHPDVAMLWEDRSFAIKRIVGKRVAGNKLCVPNQIHRHPTWLERLSRRYGWFVHRHKSAVSIDRYLKEQDLRLVLIVRSPESIISSMMRRGDLDRDAAIARWSQGTQILDELAQQEKERSVVVQFEELLQSPRAHIEAISAFLGLPFSEQMLEGHKHTKLYDQHDGIDASKTSSSDHAINLDLSTTQPAALTSYQRLCEATAVQPTP